MNSSIIIRFELECFHILEIISPEYKIRTYEKPPLKKTTASKLDKHHFRHLQGYQDNAQSIL